MEASSGGCKGYSYVACCEGVALQLMMLVQSWSAGCVHALHRWACVSLVNDTNNMHECLANAAGAGGRGNPFPRQLAGFRNWHA